MLLYVPSSRAHTHTSPHCKHCVNYLFTNRKPIEYDPLISCSFSCLSYLPASTWHPSTASFSSGGPPPPANEWDTCALAARRTRTTSACPRLAEICSGVFKMLMSSCQTITGTALQSPVPINVLRVVCTGVPAEGSVGTGFALTLFGLEGLATGKMG